MTSGGNSFNHFDENQLTKSSARNAGDFSDAAGEREMAPKCGSLPRDAGDLVGLSTLNIPVWQYFHSSSSVNSLLFGMVNRY